VQAVVSLHPLACMDGVSAQQRPAAHRSCSLTAAVTALWYELESASELAQSLCGLAIGVSGGILNDECYGGALLTGIPEGIANPSSGPVQLRCG
jgi:hypothetical protein